MVIILNKASSILIFADSFNWLNNLVYTVDLYMKAINKVIFSYLCQVFQPMLMKYFTFEELRSLKSKVIRKHQQTIEEKFDENEECVCKSML